jgi:DNA adenine methylase
VIVHARKLQAPFPWFGGKSQVAHIVWERFGNVPNYVEPFFGSGAVLLNRPHEPACETINDADGFVANFWRAVQADPEQVARYADWPVNENDLHARHAWLVQRRDTLTRKLEGDPDFHDAKIAGWWCWGLCCWIGGGWCSGKGAWQVVDGELVKIGGKGQGVNRQRVHLGDKGRGVTRKREPLNDWMIALSNRLRYVRVCCGDWSRVCGETPTVHNGLTGVFLDPPYADTADRSEVYSVDDTQVAHAVREWAIERGDDPRMRIALCGYEGEHVMPDSWECVAWKARGGYGSQSDKRGRANAERERIWFSPHCLKPGREALLWTP